MNDQPTTEKSPTIMWCNDVKHLRAGAAMVTLRGNPVPRASQVSPRRTEIPSVTRAPSLERQLTPKREYKFPNII